MTTELNQASLTAPPGKTNWLDVVRDIFLLKTSVFVHFRDSQNGFRAAIFLLIVVTLIANSLVFVWGGTQPDRRARYHFGRHSPGLPDVEPDGETCRRPCTMTSWPRSRVVSSSHVTS
ncbi:MAG: hypothetical protein HZY76_10685 [Anaerolineae bacterium]|nr:MAG: hypothetical protein HZY76_10685 [Anaerolineae bacterium]